MDITELEPVIGLETHVELSTRTKLFCGCSNRFGGDPNTHVCPVCLGLPGVLPIVNRQAVALLLRAGIAIGCKVPPKSKFDRKNYFYPDMPKNYQISQYDLPLTVDGEVKIEIQGITKTVRIERIHLEEDTGKSIHVASKDLSSHQAGQGDLIPSTKIIGGRIGQSEYTLVDYNRAGVPLIEIVTKPDLGSPVEAVAFLQELRLILQTIEVSDCKMEEGRMRCDANVSIRKTGSSGLGTKVEIKNMNSFKSVKDALAFEIERQKKAWSIGEKIIQETRGWDEKRKQTFPMRSKEQAHDYRYFPEPDLPPFEISPESVEQIRDSLPELPGEKRMRYRETFKLTEQEAEVITSTPAISQFFDEAVKLHADPKELSNWLRGDILRYLNEKGIDITQTKLTPGAMAELVELTSMKAISINMAREILPELLEKGESPKELVRQKGLAQISDVKLLGDIVASVLAEPVSAKAVEEYRGGNVRAIGFLVGAIMKKTGGKANPGVVNKLLKESLENIS